MRQTPRCFASSGRSGTRNRAVIPSSPPASNRAWGPAMSYATTISLALVLAVAGVLYIYFKELV